MNRKFNLDLIRGRLLRDVSEPELEVALAAVAIIIDPEERGGSILMIRRREREDDPWSGQIAFPGGRKSRKDRGLSDAAIREAREEVGIHLNDHLLLGHLPLVATRSHQMRVLPFVFQLNSHVKVHVNEEVAEAFWVPLTDLERLEVGRRKVRVEEDVLTVDSYKYEGHVIWGLTFRITNLLLATQSKKRTTAGRLLL